MARWRHKSGDDGRKDAVLVASACAGDDQAFAALFRRHAPDLVRFVERRCGSATEADDVVAVTFERAWIQVCELQRRNVPFRPWIFRLAGNELIDVSRAGGRRREREARVAQPDLVDVNSVESNAVDREVNGVDVDALRTALSTLHDTHQEVISLRWFGDLDPVEVASALGISSGAVAVRTHRALAALRMALVATAEVSEVDPAPRGAAP